MDVFSAKKKITQGLTVKRKKKFHPKGRIFNGKEMKIPKPNQVDRHTKINFR